MSNGLIEHLQGSGNLTSHKLLVKRIGLVGIANLLLVLNGIILLPILTKNLSVSEYGIWVQITVTIGLIPTIALIGLPHSMVRFLAAVKDKKEIQNIFYSIASIIFSASLVSFALINLLSVSIASALFNGDAFVVRMLSLIVFVECLNSITVNYLRAMQRIKKYAAFTAFRVLLGIVLVACFVMSGHGIYGAMFGILITAIATLLITAAVIISEIGIALPKFKNIMGYLSFGLPTVPGSLSSWMVESCDRYIIGIMLGTAAVGYYSPGFTLGKMIGIFLTPVSFLLPAVLAMHYDEHEIAEVGLIMNYSMKYFLCLSIPSFFGLTLLSKPILAALSTQDIASNGYLITPFSALSALFLGAYAVIAQVIILEKKTKIIGAIWICAAVINLGLNLILVSYMGIMGAAVTTLVVCAFTLVSTTYYSNKYLKFSFDLSFIAKSISASILMSISIFWLHPEGAQQITIAIVIGALIYFLGLLLLKGVTREEASLLNKLLRS